MRLLHELAARYQHLCCAVTNAAPLIRSVRLLALITAHSWRPLLLVAVATCMTGLSSRFVTADPPSRNTANGTAQFPGLQNAADQPAREQIAPPAATPPAAAPESTTPGSSTSPQNSAEVTRQAVEAAIRDLNSDRIAVRRAAEKSLRALGPAALPWLPPRSRIRTPAVRDVIERLRVELELQQATASLDASKVNLQGTRTLGDWCALISQSTGNRIDVSRLAPARLAAEFHFNAGEVSFWTAIHELELAGNVVARMNADTPCIDLLPILAVQVRETALSVDGPFRTRIERVAWIGPAVQRQLLGISVRIDIEPRLQPLKLRIPANAVRVTAADQVCPPFDPDQQLSLLFAEGVRSVACELRFHVPPTARQAAAVQVSAELNCVILAGVGEVRFGPLKNLLSPQQPAAQRRGAVNTTLLGLERTTFKNGGDTWRFSVDWSYDDRNAEVESHETIRLTSQPFFLHPQLGAYPFPSQDPAGIAQPQLARLLSATHRSRIEQQECAYQHACVTGEFRGLPAEFMDAELVCTGPSLVADRKIQVLAIDAPIASPPKTND